VHGSALDTAIGDILVEAMTPLAIEVALGVQQELANRQEEADRLRRQHVERAKYDAELAQRRFLKVDPDNRLVADALEADWNTKLRALAAAQDAYDKASAVDVGIVTDAERTELMALATDFSRLWRNPRTQMKDKKRMLRLLIEDVTLSKGDTLHVDIRFVGGAMRSLDLPLPKSCVELRTTDAAVIEEIDHLIDTYTDKEIAGLLNERGVRTVVSSPWTAARIGRLRHTYHLTDRRERLLAQGLLTPQDIAARYNVVVSTVHGTGGRLQIGMVGEIISESWATSIGIRIRGVAVLLQRYEQGAQDAVPAALHRREIRRQRAAAIPGVAFGLFSPAPAFLDPASNDLVRVKKLLGNAQPGGQPTGGCERFLRRIALTVPNFMFALAVIAETDFISALPRRFVAMHAARSTATAAISIGISHRLLGVGESLGHSVAGTDQRAIFGK